MAKRFRIVHAKITLEGFGDRSSSEYFRSSLEQSWTPGAQVTRYERSWRLSKSAEHDEGVWHGRIGFVKEGELSTLDWDDSKEDFIRGEASSGVVVPFLIDGGSRIVSFQLVSGQVRTKTVTSNLQALFNTSKAHYWKIEPLSFKTGFEDWKSTVSCISKCKFRLSYPNPNWTGRENIKELMDGLRAEVITLRARADKESSIETDSDLFQQAMDHIRLGYGSAEMVGTERGSGDESKFVLTEDGGYVPAVDKIDVEGEETEATAQEAERSAIEASRTRSNPES